MNAFAIASVLPGLAIGSFLNVVAARVPKGLSLVRPASSCMGCSREIAAYDNIPVFSWLVLRGRCRHCGERISPLYPAVEAVTAGLVAACVVDFGVTWMAALASFFCIVLVTLTAADVRYRLVPNRIVIPAFVVCLIGRTALDPSVEWIAAALIASTAMLVCALIYPAGLGMGDVKLTLLLGAMLGRTVAPALFIGFVAGLVPSIVLFARHGARARKMSIPLVPFLALGALVGLFFGDRIVDWYLSAGF